MTEQTSGNPPGPEPEPKPAKTRKKLTRKQERLARASVKDPTATLRELGEKSGYSDPAKTHREINKPHVRERIRELMNAHPDTSLEGLTSTLRQGLKATRVRPFKTQDDRIIYAAPLVDHSVRHTYLETALVMHGAMDKPTKGGTDEEPPMSLSDAILILAKVQQQVNVQVNVNSPEKEA